MKFLIINHTRFSLGAHATTMLIDQFVNSRLGEYGAGVESIWIQLLYPDNMPTAPGPPGLDELIARAPRAVFFRIKRKIKIDIVCPKVPPPSIATAAHLEPKEIDHVFATILSALELIRPKIRRTDDFDLLAFLADMHSILPDCRKDVLAILKSA